MNKDIAISVKNARPVTPAIRVTGVSKTFRIPHEKISSLLGAALSVFSRNRGYEEFKVHPVTSSIVTGTLDNVSFEACPTHYNSFLNF